MGFPKKLNSSHLLAVEGKCEEKLLEKLKQVLGFESQVLEFGGKPQMTKNFPSLPTIPGFSQVIRIGIIRDADDNHDSAFQSVQDMITKAGLTPPTSVGSFTTGNPSIGVYLMPDNKSNGMLEDLFLESVSKNPGFQCVEDFEKCVEKLPSKPRNMAKARSLAYLATCKKSCGSVGLAAAKGYWDFSAPCLDPLKEFLKEFNS